MEGKIRLDIVMNSTFNSDVGGRETWLYNFLPELLKDTRFEKVTLFGFRMPDQEDFTNKLESLDPQVDGKKRLFPVIFKKERGRLPIAHSMYKCLKAHTQSIGNPPDFVLAVGVFEMLMVLRIPYFKQAKKVVWLRSIFTHEKAYAIPKLLNRLFLNYELKKLKRMDVVLGNGDDIEEFYGSHGIHVNVIKNGVAMNKWDMPFPNFEDPIHVSYVGRLSQVKGIEDYLSLIEKIKLGPKADQFVFHIVGDNGPYASQVNDLTQKNFVINHNRIPNDELTAFLGGIDVCVALTYASSEGGGGGTSNAMMEQMAAGRVMLAWKNRIFSQYLDETNAYLAEQYSVEGLEQALYKLLDDRSEALAKSEKGKETIYPYSYALNVSKFKEALGIA